MITDDVFTEGMVATAKEMETACASELARYYRSTMDKHGEVKVKDLENLPDSEKLRIISELAKEVENQIKNVKILDDIRNGKYRILFLALARHTERAREEIERAIGVVGGIHDLTEMIKGLADKTEEEKEENEDNE